MFSKKSLLVLFGLLDEKPDDYAEHAEPGDDAGDGDQRQDDLQRRHPELRPVHRGALPVVVLAGAVIVVVCILVRALAVRKLNGGSNDQQGQCNH